MVSLVETAARNPVVLLRCLADEIEAGTEPPVCRLVVVTQRDTAALDVRAAGPGDNFTMAGVLSAGVVWLVTACAPYHAH